MSWAVGPRRYPGVYPGGLSSGCPWPTLEGFPGRVLGGTPGDFVRYPLGGFLGGRHISENIDSFLTSRSGHCKSYRSSKPPP